MSALMFSSGSRIEDSALRYSLVGVEPKQSRLGNGLILPSRARKQAVTCRFGLTSNDVPTAVLRMNRIACRPTQGSANRKFRRAFDSRCGPFGEECTNRARRGGSIHNNCELVLRRRGAGLSGTSPAAVTAGASFSHNHEVFELQEVFELSSFFGTQSVALARSIR
jgi:hypothetical protein